MRIDEREDMVEFGFVFARVAALNALCFCERCF